jgi:hypothetical protein
VVVAFCGALILIAQALETSTAIGIALDSGVQWASGGEWTI